MQIFRAWRLQTCGNAATFWWEMGPAGKKPTKTFRISSCFHFKATSCATPAPSDTPRSAPSGCSDHSVRPAQRDWQGNGPVRYLNSSLGKQWPDPSGSSGSALPSILCLPAMLSSLRPVPPCAPISSPNVKLDFGDLRIQHIFSRTRFLAMRAGMAQLEGYYFSAALSCTFLVSCLLFSAFSRALREPYMDEIFHLPQAQRYCEGHFSLSQVGSPTCLHPRTG